MGENIIDERCGCGYKDECYVHCNHTMKECPGLAYKATEDVHESSGSAKTELSSKLAQDAQSEAPSVDGWLLELLRDYSGMDFCEADECSSWQACKEFMGHVDAKINRLIVKAYNNGFSDGKKIRQKYEVGDIGGNYRITERFRRVGKNIKYKVVCTLCGAPMFRYSNKFNLRHKDCGALSNNLSKEQLGEK